MTKKEQLQLFIRENNLKLFITEDEAAAKLLEIYRKAKAEITLKLLDADLSNISRTRLNSLLQQIETEIIATTKQDISGFIGKTVNDVSKISIANAITELKFIAPRITVDFNKLPVKALKQLTQINRDNLFKGIDKTWDIVKKETVNGWGIIQSEVGTGIAKGEGSMKLVQRLMTNADNLWDAGKYNQKKMATATARTLVNTSFNQAHLETYKKSSVENLQKQWLNVDDSVTTDICHGLNGQIRDLDDDFEWQGWKGDAPPAIGIGAVPEFHYCRSTIVPYHPSFEGF